MLEDVGSGLRERGVASVGVDRTSHLFYSRFINYRTVIVAAALVIWRALDGGFSDAGTAVLVVTVAALAALASAQVVTLRA